MADHPFIDALIEKARRYRQEYTIQHGRPPVSWLVTEEEYAQLVVPLCGRISDDLQLMGMRVKKPRRVAWDPSHYTMEHCGCVTHLPGSWGRKLACPCGRVIWEMPTYRDMRHCARQRMMDAFHAAVSELTRTPLADTDRPLTRRTIEQQLTSVLGPRPRVVDSEKRSLEEWSTDVDTLIQEMGGEESPEITADDEFS